MVSQKKQPVPGKTRKALARALDASDEPSDPFAAAVAAIEAKRLERLKAAAVAAARAAPPDITTFFPDTPTRGAESSSAFGVPASKSPCREGAASPPLANGERNAERREASPIDVHERRLEGLLQGRAGDEEGDAGAEETDVNSLAYLLGYRVDDGSDHDSGDEEGSRKEVEGGQSTNPDQGSLNDVPDSMDAEFASFMSDLQASGLLKEGEGDAEGEGGAEEDRDAVANQSPDQAPPAHAHDGLLAAEDSDGSFATLGTPGLEADCSESTGAVEQRVLGELEGCLGWHEVMDMSTGRVYFWDSATNAVAWEPPEGSFPRSKESNAAIFAEAQTSGSEIQTSAADAQASTADGDARGIDEGASSPSSSQPKEAEQAPPPTLTPEGSPPSEAIPEEPLQTLDAPGKALIEASTNDLPVQGEGVDITAPLEGPAVKMEEAQLPPVPHPADDLGPGVDALVASVWPLAEAACGGAIPLIVRLAIEAEVRQRDWHVLAGVQSSSATSGDADHSLNWSAYEHYMRTGIEALQGAAADIAMPPAEEVPVLPVDEPPLVPYGAGSDGSDNDELEEGEVAPPKPETVEVDMEVDLPEDVPPLPADESAPYSPTRPEVLETLDPPLPHEVPDLPGSPPPLPEATLAASPPPAEHTPPLPDDTADALPPLPMSNGYMHAVESAPQAAAEFMSAALVGPPVEPLPAVTAPVVKRKEYRAEPVYIAPALPSEPVLEEPQPPPMEPPPVPEAEPTKKKRDRGPTAPTSKKRVKLAKEASSLINKWAAVRRDLEEEDQKAEEIPDADALERKRAREAEEWRLQQLRAGKTAEDNANFQPLAVDWREKVRLAQKKAASAEPKEAPEASAPEGGKPDLKALSEGLPEGWRAMWDQGSSSVYYGNLTTKETTWDRPT